MWQVNSNSNHNNSHINLNSNPNNLPRKKFMINMCLWFGRWKYKIMLSWWNTLSKNGRNLVNRRDKKLCHIISEEQVDDKRKINEIHILLQLICFVASSTITATRTTRILYWMCLWMNHFSIIPYYYQIHSKSSGREKSNGKVLENTKLN